MNRHKNREKALICVYQYLIFAREVNELVSNSFTEEEIKEDTYMQSVIQTAIDKKDLYAGYIDRVLDDWSFDRLGTIEQAILLCGCAEFDLKQIEAAVIIDEYVEFAKTYGDDSYKLVNGVLDRI